MPRDSIRTLVMSAEKDAVKRFISHMHQSWDQLQVETSQVGSESLEELFLLSNYVILIVLLCSSVLHMVQWDLQSVMIHKHLIEGQNEYTLLLCFLCQASQKELQAMETMTAAFIHKFPRVTPELFVDLSQFIPFMSVSDIMSFPASLIVNDSV